MLTPFGKYIVNLRRNRLMLMGDFAEKVNERVSFVSAVETGKRAIPADWHDKIIEIFSLSEKEITALEKSIIETEISQIFRGAT